MRNLLLFFGGFLGVIVLLGGLLWYAQQPPNSPAYLSDDTIQVNNKYLPIILEINHRNKQVHSFCCKDIRIHISNQLPIAIFGDVSYQKHKNFRMKVSTRLGLESDIGSNKDQFWFWSKRMSPADLYYADHKDINKTALKTPLNPLWLMESLSLGKVDVKDAKIGKYGDLVAVLQPRISTLNEPVKVLTLIDPTTKIIRGHYVYNSENKLEASSEVIDVKYIDNIPVPTKILFIWYSEGRTLEWDFYGPKINLSLPDSLWKMPKIEPKVNMVENQEDGFND